MRNVYFELLRNRPQMRLLWLAQVVSLLGDWFGTIAAIILVNRYTDSGLAVSLLFLARGLPSFVATPIVGVVADRFNRRVVLVITDILQTIVGFSFLLILEFESVALLYVLTVLQFTLAAFFEPARAAILPELVENNQELLVANTLASTTWSAMLAVGAAIGGLTTTLFGVEVAIIVNALTYILSAILISYIHVEPPEREQTQEGNQQRNDFVDGLNYMLANRKVAIYANVKSLSQVGSIDTMFTLYAASVFIIGTEGATTLGVLYMAFGLGAILGPVFANRYSDESPRFFRRWIWIGFVMVPVGWGGFAIAPALGIAAIAIVIRAMGNSINWTYSNIQLQLNVPDQYLGRVFAMDFSLFTLAYTIAVVLTGLLNDTFDFSPRTIAMIFAVMGCIPLLLWTFALQYLEKLDENEAQIVVEAV